MAETESTDPIRRGVGYWMERVLAECAKARNGFDADAVHDLRVAIRRCRSMGEGFQSIDGSPLWNKMRKAGKAVFSALGELRDTQVLIEWIERLKDACPPVAERLRAHCLQRETTLKNTATQAIDRFDTRRWQQWARSLEARVRRLGEPADVFQMLALAGWEGARALHTTAMRSRGKAALHALRIGIKKFRYVVENFLPEHHQRWGQDLKHLQDLLGEVHDLDVLWDTACRIHAFASLAERRQWYAAIARERTPRVATYREKMGGRHSLWQEWRKGLPMGGALRKAVLRRFGIWAATLDAYPAHTRAVARFSLKLYDAAGGFNPPVVLDAGSPTPRDLLQVAAIAHEVGRSHGAKAHHKSGRRLIERLEVPPGWTAQDLRIAALVARYHRGALPRRQRSYVALGAIERRIVDFLAGILRLANSLDRPRHSAIRKISVAQRDGVVEILAEGYVPRSKQAERIAAARHLFESVRGIPVIVRESKTSDSPQRAPNSPRRAQRTLNKNQV
jgi:exopolyphosphatase/guanosine-5'-triphosphate,3'-diphosphate pyrophosphatase